MSSPAFEIQKAVKLKFDAALATALISCAVYDDVPQGAAKPYVRIGEGTELEWDTDSSIGLESTITVHTWSEYAGFKEVREIMTVLKNSLHNQSLTVTGQNVVLVLFEFSEVFLDSDGRTRHGVQRFRLLTEN